jgi:excisionase family DNA binding protein
MTKSILQLENTNAADFKNEILEDFKAAFESLLNNQFNNDDKLLTREEAASLLSISLVTLWDWTKKDLFPAYRIGNKVFYKKVEIMNALQKQNNFN